MSRYFSHLIILFYSLNIFIRAYGIWFPRWAWDEDGYYFGAVNITTVLSGLFHGEFRYQEMYDFISPDGALNKYVCVFPVSLGIVIERLFNIHYPIPLGLIFCRIALSLIPNILIIFYTQKIIKTLWNSRLMALINLVLFALPFRLIETSVYSVSDSLVTLLSVISVYYLICYAHATDENRKLHFLKINLLFCVLAISTKCPPGFAAAGASVCIVLFDYYRGQLLSGCLKKTSIFLLTKMLPLFVLLNIPYLLLLNEWIQVVFDYKYIIKGHPLIYFYTIPSMGMGWGLTLLALTGLLYSLIFQGKKLLPVYFFMLILYVFLSTTTGATHNWQIPLIPFFILFTGILFTSLFTYIKLKSRETISLVVLFVSLLGISFVPVKNIIGFKKNILESPGTKERAISFLKPVAKDEFIFVLDEKIRSISDLEKSKVKYIVFRVC